jgi:MATE family multidrug resistance protein
MAIVGYWAIGAPVGVGLAFFTPLRGRGLWIGLACGLAATSLQLLARWRRAERRGFLHAVLATHVVAREQPPNAVAD